MFWGFWGEGGADRREVAHLDPRLGQHPLDHALELVPT